jgi:ribosome-associated protein
MDPRDDQDLLAAEDQGPSKSQRKRDMHALQALGEALAAQSVERLRSLDLPDGLLDAFLHVKSIKAHGAVRRQMQYIGRLMRDIDAVPLRAQLDAWNGVSREAVQRSHQAEHWRERLLASDEAFGELLEEYPDLDIPTLRTLIRNARRERSESRPLRNFRELYRAVLALIEHP